MATAYIQPGAATTNNGTTPALALGYASSSEREAASTLADDDGTIIFLDGNYTIGTEIQRDLTEGFAGGFSGQKWKSDTALGAILTVTSTAYWRGVNLTDFKIIADSTAKGYLWIVASPYTAEITMIRCSVDYSACQITSMAYNGTVTLKESSFIFGNITTLGFYYQAAAGPRGTIEFCSFYFGGTNCFSILKGVWYGATTDYTIKNSIFMVSAANTTTDFVWNNGADLDIYSCCFFDASGTAADSSTDGDIESDLLFKDPKFIDTGAGNFNLRPDSPCVGAGTIE